jgi:hypothetical protein
MRKRLQLLLAKAFRFLQQKPDQSATIRELHAELTQAREREDSFRADYIERSTELIEARQMAGSGPWLVAESREQINKPGKLRETNALTSTGAFGDVALALENLEWRREVNLSWLEFSRWGIQQIMLVSRLYYIKNPIIRRLIDVAAYYVFGRGVEVSSPDDGANQVLKDFFERNKSTLGQIAMVELEKRKYYDGNLFFVFFADKISGGNVNVRTIDATEIQDIITDPDDSDTPWFYRRGWRQRSFDVQTGASDSKDVEAWYPAIGYEPETMPTQINGLPVMKDNPILHRKAGGVSKWNFGCPIIYPALTWAKASVKYLESCATVKKALASIAMTLTTKGGQQAIAGAKNQLGTSVGPPTQSWDTTPPPIDGSIFASGPGTTLKAFHTGGAGGNPEDVRRFTLMACMVVGVPETFLADVSTGNLATATTLDRPTELGFLEKQEAWREDLITISKYVLKVSNGAPKGILRASMDKKKIGAGEVLIREAKLKRSRDGRRLVPVKEAAQTGEVIVTVNFPAILEGDVPAMVTAIVHAMTLENKGGQVVGIDEKVGNRALYDTLGIENGDEIIEEQFPDGEYDPDRTKEPLPAPIMKALPDPGGAPQLPGGEDPPPPKQKESRLDRAARLVEKALAAVE